MDTEVTAMGKKGEPGVWGGLGFRQGAFEGGKNKAGRWIYELVVHGNVWQ